VPAYRGSAAPKDFSHRYIVEEIPTQVVPACCIARMLGVDTPVMAATAVLAGAVAGENFMKTGWTQHVLGIDGLDPASLLAVLLCGFPADHVP
jgi:hypothetical protein